MVWWQGLKALADDARGRKRVQSGLGVEIPYAEATAQVACTVYSGLNP